MEVISRLSCTIKSLDFAGASFRTFVVTDLVRSVFSSHKSNFRNGSKNVLKFFNVFKFVSLFYI